MSVHTGMSRFWKLTLASLLLLSWANQIQAFELVVKATQPDGSPVPGVAIQKVLLVHHHVVNALAGRTDERGELSVPFEGMTTIMDGTGEGEYRLLAMPEDYRWEMSPKYFWTYPPRTYEAAPSVFRDRFDDAQRNPAPPQRNADIGETIWAAPDVPNVWNVCLQRAKDVTVTVKDQTGAPVPNADLEMQVDLCAPTHTGFGGEVDLPQVRTDERGCFVLHQAGDFFYTFTACTREYCSPTMDWGSNSVVIRFAGEEGTLLFHKCTPKRLSVKVLDRNTHAPVEGATLWLVNQRGERILQNDIGCTDRDGVFKAEEFLLSDVAAAISIRRCDVVDSYCVPTYESSSIDMDGFDPSRDYVIELAPR